MLKRLLLLVCGLALLHPALSAQTKLYFMERATGKSIPLPSSIDVQIPESSQEGVYSAVIKINKGMTFGFYTGELGDPETIYQSIGNSNLSFYGMENPVWPSGNNYNAGAMREKGPAEIGTWWCILSFTDPQEKVAPVLVTVDLNSKQITLAQQDINEELPECLYIWGSPDGEERFQCVARMEPMISNPTVFETIYNVPEVLEFIDNTGDGGGSTAGDDEGPHFPDHGFRFNISTDGLSVTGGKKFYAPLTDFLIDFSESAEPFGSDLAVLQGSVFFDLTPGETLIRIDYETKKITVEYIEEADWQNLFLQ